MLTSVAVDCSATPILGDGHEQIVEDFEPHRVGVGADRALTVKRHGAGQISVPSDAARRASRTDNGGRRSFQDRAGRGFLPIGQSNTAISSPIAGLDGRGTGAGCGWAEGRARCGHRLHPQSFDHWLLVLDIAEAASGAAFRRRRAYTCRRTDINFDGRVAPHRAQPGAVAEGDVCLFDALVGEVLPRYLFERGEANESPRPAASTSWRRGLSSLRPNRCQRPKARLQRDGWQNSLHAERIGDPAGHAILPAPPKQAKV